MHKFEKLLISILGNSVQSVNFKKEILICLFIQVLPARPVLRRLRRHSQAPYVLLPEPGSGSGLYEQTYKDFL